jgi:hypothetical protein
VVNLLTLKNPFSRKQMKNIIFVLLLVSSPLFAVNEFYSLTRSIRSLGMGGAFFGMSDDEYALFSNPAGLSLRQDNTEVKVRLNGQVSNSAISGFKDFTNLGNKNLDAAINTLNEHQGKPMYGQAGFLPSFLRKNLALGLLVADTKLGFNITQGISTDPAQIALMDPNAEIADLTAISDSGIVLGYGQSIIHPNLHLGLNLKGLFRAGGRKAFTAAEYLASQKINIDPKEIGGSGMGVDLDLGATYEMPYLPFGVLSRASVVFSNLLATEFSSSRQGGVPPRMVRTANLGWYTAFEGVGFVDNFHLLADISDIPLGGESNPNLGARNTGSFLKKVHLGVEMPIGRLSLRTGINQGYLTAGVGLNLSFIKLDFATYGEETGGSTNQQSRRYALTMAFGWGGGPAEPVTRQEEKVVTPVKTEPVKAVAPEKTEPKPESTNSVTPKN